MTDISDSFWSTSPYGYGKYISNVKIKSELKNNCTTETNTSENENVESNNCFQQSIDIECREFMVEDSKSIFFDNPMSFRDVNIRLLEIRSSQEDIPSNNLNKFTNLSSANGYIHGIESIRSSANLTSTTSSDESCESKSTSHDLLTLNSCDVYDDFHDKSYHIYKMSDDDRHKVVLNNIIKHGNSKSKSNDSFDPPIVSNSDLLFYEATNQKNMEEIKIDESEVRKTLDTKFTKPEIQDKQNLKNRNLNALYKQRYRTFNESDRRYMTSSLENISLNENKKKGKFRSYIETFNKRLKSFRDGFNRKNRSKQFMDEREIDSFDYSIFV